MIKMDKIRSMLGKRLGLEVREIDHIKQYIEYLKGLHFELEHGDFDCAKSHYFDVLQFGISNHRIRKATLKRLVDINIKMKLPPVSPEKIML